MNVVMSRTVAEVSPCSVAKILFNLENEPATPRSMQLELRIHQRIDFEDQWLARQHVLGVRVVKLRIQLVDVTQRAAIAQRIRGALIGATLKRLHTV